LTGQKLPDSRCREGDSVGKRQRFAAHGPAVEQKKTAHQALIRPIRHGMRWLRRHWPMKWSHGAGVRDFEAMEGGLHHRAVVDGSQG